MNWRRVWTVFRKDTLDAIRNARVLVAIITPIGIGLLYGAVVEDEPERLGVTIALHAEAASELPAVLQSLAGEGIRLDLKTVAREVDLRTLIEQGDVDAGLQIPAGFDAAVRQGDAPPLSVLLPASPTFGSTFLAASLDEALRRLSGRAPPAVLRIEQVEKRNKDLVVDQLGPRRYLVLNAVIMLIGMITVLVLPIILTEETEQGTLDALTMVASQTEVVAAKALVGVLYTALAVSIMLPLTGVRPEEPAMFAAAVAALSVTLVAFGLLLGGLFRSTTQLNTWSGLFLVPLILPPFLAGAPLPAAVSVLVQVVPTTHGFRIAANALIGQAIFQNTWASFLALAAWAVVVYALVVWRIARREI